MKKSLGPKTLLYPTPVWVVGSYDKAGRPNAMTIAWGGICCSRPPCVGLCQKGNVQLWQQHGAKGIHGEYPFRVARQRGRLRRLSLRQGYGQVYDSKTHSGEERPFDAPYIEEFPLILECTVVHVIDVGMHTQFIGQILDVKADEAVLDRRGLPDIEKIRPILFSPETYLGSIALTTGIFSGSLLLKAHAGGVQWWSLALIGILLLLCTSHLAVALVNWLATLLTTPHLLPRMDFSGGIPPESRTLVVIPTMLTSAQNVEDLAEALEVRFLANRDENLRSALVTDLRDAPKETLPEDEPLLQLARKRVEELNKKFSDSKSDTFFLFHRPRRWNPRERIAWFSPALLGGA